MRILSFALSLLLLRSSEAALTNSNAARLAKLGVPPFGTGYDPSTPPWEVTGKPLTVRLTLVFRDILNVDELSCEATIMTQVNQYFADPRLKYKSSDFGIGMIRFVSTQIPFDMSKTFWIPSLIYKGASSYSASWSHLLLMSDEQLEKDDNIRLLRNEKATVKQDFNFAMFPFDIQRVRWLAYSHDSSFEKKNSRQQLLLTVQQVRTDQLPENPTYHIGKEFHGTAEHTFGLTGNKVMLIAVDVNMERFLNAYMVKSIVPLSVIVVASSLSFWIHPDAVPARVGFGVTMILVGVSQTQAANKEIPKVSYLTVMDYFGASCIAFLSSCLVVYAYVHHLRNRATEKESGFGDTKEDKAVFLARAESCDKRCRIIHPLLFLMILVAGAVAALVIQDAERNKPAAPPSLTFGRAKDDE